MAKAKKFVPTGSLLDLVESTKPASPVMSAAEKTYFKSLKKRGFSEEQIRKFIISAGYSAEPDFFLPSPKFVKKMDSQTKPDSLKQQYGSNA
jgi:hypothetical protein